VFDFVTRRGRAARVEGPLFDVFKVWDIVPSCKFVVFFRGVVGSLWSPEATQDSLFVAVDISVVRNCWSTWVGDFDWILFTPFLFGKGFVAKGLGNELLFRRKSHDAISVMSWMNRMLRQ
jgi:hypothetical protein